VHEHDQNTERARALRKESTLTEEIVWRWLRNRRFGDWKFRRQYPIGPYIADFYCDALKLVIEIDGETHDYSFEYDERRRLTSLDSASRP
jgi:YD repeat-containing protein